MADPLRYHLFISGQGHLVRELTGREAISEPFRFQVTLHLADGVDVDPLATVKEPAALRLVRDDAERTISGVVSEIVVTETATGAPKLVATIEPLFALARYRTNIKAFVAKNVVTIVTEVLSELGVKHALRLASSYPIRPYTVQFRETDFHFVSRMLEEEGIFYFFDEDGTMVLADAASSYDAAGALPFRHTAGADQHEDAILTMGARSRATAGSVSLRDWTPDAPSMPMDVEAAGPTPGGPVWYDFPGEYGEPGAGQGIADRRAEALACVARGWSGRSSSARIAPGRLFDLWNAPGGLRDGSYVVSALDHDFEIDRAGFSVRFEALAGDQTFRALNRHEEPVLPNPLVGHVTGPPGADIHCDALGRVKVHFPWDRLQPRDDSCSHWVPVLQDNLAESVSIPRVGWEVLVHFLEGDPDRPVILGRVYNGEEPFHHDLPLGKTVTGLRSLSSPSRDGENFIEIDDLAGRELLNVHAERNQDIVVLNDKTETVKNLENHRIKRDETIAIGRDERNEIRQSDYVPLVEGDRRIAIAGNREREGAAGDGITVGGNHSLSIAGSHNRKMGRTDETTAKRLSHSVGGVILEASIKANTTSAGKALASLTGGVSVEIAATEKSDDAAKGAADITGAVALTKTKKEMRTSVMKDRHTFVGGTHKTTAKKEVTLTGAESFASTSKTAEITASERLTFEIGDTVLTLAEGQLTLTTKESITTTLQARAKLGAEVSSQISPEGE